MLNKIFPYKLYLHIFQLDEYDVFKFLKWIFSHYSTRHLEDKKPLIWTQKAKAIFSLSILLTILTILLFTYVWDLSGIALGIIIAMQPFIFLIGAYYLLLPFEIYQKKRIKIKTKHKLQKLSNLKIIGITGSYGKTSVKEFLYQIVKTQHHVLKTPESYNTPYGIAKVVKYELDNSYEYFICEMGAYRIGEIKEICDMVHPRYGILTGINEQHLETFGSLENTTKGKFELIDSLPENGFGLVNGNNPYIQHNLHNYQKKIYTYGLNDKKFSLSDIKQTPEGSNFTLILDGTHYKAQTNLIGMPNLGNILAASSMSYLLGMKPKSIIEAIKTLTPVPHRLEIIKQNNITIIDDAYNSNVNGFEGAVNLLKSFKPPTILVTPGIVDLGNQTFSIHKALGEKLDAIDYIILIGKSERTRGLKAGIKHKEKIIELQSIREVWDEIKKLKLTNPVVLLENDLPDQY